MQALSVVLVTLDCCLSRLDKNSNTMVSLLIRCTNRYETTSLAQQKRTQRGNSQEYTTEGHSQRFTLLSNAFCTRTTFNRR